MKSLAILLPLIFPLALTAQTKTFREDFNDNKRKWFTGSDDEYEAAIENGFYTVECKQTEKTTRNILMSYGKIELYKPFDIEIRIKLMKASGTQNSYGITIGEKDRGNAYYFVVSQELKMSWWYHYSLWRNKVIKNEPLQLTTFKNDDPASGTKIFVKSRDGNLYFYVNEEYLTKVERPKVWDGTGVGLYLNPGTKVTIDYIDLKQY